MLTSFFLLIRVDFTPVHQPTKIARVCCLLPSAASCSPAYEMNNLDAIAILKFSVPPFAASDNLPINFDCDALRSE